MAEERRGDRRGDINELYDAGNGHDRQRLDVRGGGEQCRGEPTSTAATLTVSAAPVAPSITTQPANQTVTAGQTATFSVVASGTAPLSYQWQKNGAAIARGDFDELHDTGDGYDGQRIDLPVVVTTRRGRDQRDGNADGDAARWRRAITTQPANHTVTAGQTATFSVVAGGTAPLSYQWQKNGWAIGGATADELYDTG